MRNIALLTIFTFITFGCHNPKTESNLDRIKDINIIQCYTLERIFPQVLKLNEIAKTDSSFIKNQSLTEKITNQFFDVKEYPFFCRFKPYGFFAGKTMTYVNSSFLGVLSNEDRNLVNDYFSTQPNKSNFPHDIDFQFIPSPFVEKMSILIGMKNSSPIIQLTSNDLNGFGLKKIRSFDSTGKIIEPESDEKSYVPFIVFKKVKKFRLNDGVYLLKLSLSDTTFYVSLDKKELIRDTIFFEYLFDKNYIKTLK